MQSGFLQSMEKKKFFSNKHISKDYPLADFFELTAEKEVSTSQTPSKVEVLYNMSKN